MRKLASIRKIDDIRPIEGADAIECAVVGGWAVVIRKGEYQIGDLAIYCEIDSWIPTELAPFLSKGKEPREYNGVKGERLRTVKLRGQLSQGLLMPIPSEWIYVGDRKDAYSIQTEDGIINHGYTIAYKVGSCVTKRLGIQKWEAPVPAQLAGQVRGKFPTSVPKTDQERVQNLKKEVQAWTEADTLWEVTEKLDGSSCTMYLDLDNEFHVCSRNLDLKRDENNSFWKVAIQYNVEGRMTIANLEGYAIQGELIGEGIQGNPYGLKGQDFYVFDIYDTTKGQYLPPKERRKMTELLGLKHVPIICDEKDLGIGDIAEIIQWAEDKSRLNQKTEREGIVFKNVITEESFKAISNKFLLKGGN